MSNGLKPIQVKIRNFQSIESLDFEIRGFTCVTGKSSIGKSSLVRAIAGAILNVPVGGMVRKGSKFCTVELRSEEWAFRWEKGNGASRYFVPPDADKPLDKVGQGQIDPVGEMGFTSIKLGRSEAHPWYANQFKPLFLLDETGATVTDFISEVSRLQVLQDAMSISSRARKKALDEAKVRASDLVSLREKASKVQAVEDMERVAAELEEQAESVREYERRIGLAESSLRKLERGRDVLLAVEPVSSVKVPKIEQCSKDIESVRKMTRLQSSLQTWAQRVIALKPVAQVTIPSLPEDGVAKLRKAVRFSVIPRLTESVKALEGVSRAKVPDMGEVSGDLKRVAKAERIYAALERLSAGVRSMNKKIDVPEAPPDPAQLVRMESFRKKLAAQRTEIQGLDDKLNAVQAELNAVQAELNALPSCPTCGRVAAGNHSAKAHKQARPESRA